MKFKLCICLLFVYTSVFCQDFTYISNSAKSANTSGISIIEGHDESYLIAGYREKPDVFSPTLPVIIKMDYQGSILWEKKIDVPDDLVIIFDDLLKADDGNYFAVYTQHDFSLSESKPYLIKFNPEGELLWEKRLDIDIFSMTTFNNRNLLSIGDGEYLFWGISSIFNPDFQEQSLVLIRFDNEGVLSQKEFESGKESVSVRDIHLVENTLQFILSSKEKDDEFGTLYHFVLDKQTNQLQRMKLDFIEGSRSFRTIKSEDGNLIGFYKGVLGLNEVVTIIKINSKGELIKEVHILTDGIRFFPAFLKEKPEGYLIYGYGNSGNYFIETDKNGEIINKEIYYFVNESHGILDAFFTEDSFVGTGLIPSSEFRNREDFLIVKRSLQNIFTNTKIELEETDIVLKGNSPKSLIQVEFPFEANWHLALYDVLGRIALKDAVCSNYYLLQKHNLDAGVYFLVINLKNEVVWQRTLIVH